MPLFSDPERAFAESISRLVYCNPFLPERIQTERQALGDEFIETDANWNLRADSEGRHPNITRLLQRADALVMQLRAKLEEDRKLRPTREELGLYEDVVLFVLYHRHYDRLQQLILDRVASPKPLRQRVAVWGDYLRHAQRLLEIPGIQFPGGEPLHHLFACLFQVKRAFHHIFTHIVGTSPPVARLRAAVWQSICTHDMRRYRRALYNRMGDITTLITGPSGTGKELVARAIGLSRYIPFDPHTQTFTEDFAGSFHALNLSALSPTLIESELFGHRRGSFTGALQDRAGWLEVCRPLGTVFLDEIGEIDVALQVKLLRVLQTRTFQRLGDTETRQFHGKVIAATNRDIAQEMRAGRFRQDFYYRLCSDLITTPSLHEQLRHAPNELHHLILFIARRIVPEEAESLTDEVEQWIRSNLGRDYPWPGNFRELEQCVRNVMIRREYHAPASAASVNGEADDLAQSIRAGTLTADDLLRRYCAIVYRQTGSYEATARRLGLDRRTVKAKLDSGEPQMHTDAHR